MKKTFVIILGLMLGFTSVFGQDNDVDNVVSSVLRYYAHVMGALEDTYDNSRKQEAERVSLEQFEGWAQDFISYRDVVPYIEAVFEIYSSDSTGNPFDIPESRNDLRDITKGFMQFAFMAGAISQYNLSHGTNINIRNYFSLLSFPSDAKIIYDIEELDRYCSDNTFPISDDDLTDDVE